MRDEDFMRFIEIPLAKPLGERQIESLLSSICNEFGMNVSYSFHSKRRIHEGVLREGTLKFGATFNPRTETPWFGKGIVSVGLQSRESARNEPAQIESVSLDVWDGMAETPYAKQTFDLYERLGKYITDFSSED